ncbi:uncharacterized protein ATNIH1004_000707 [Aspergillus tanneri]|uniref:Uncharacterized protein n=1 Tax=Aspergillus tanneri TaxID=1220188 RepID=A0A5M9MXI1_9EURO|nr:uncharacterized protein ATNIH1004_000707 [Aspergillus tanneri]KAA8651811.1 hypothetical protein ATNIH1004_000707 [Aspergillus tanneri]
MKLRNNIRPPKRLNSEQFDSPYSQVSLRRTKNSASHSYVPYDPDLPPAAFPTLEQPRAPGQRNCDEEDNELHSETLKASQSQQDKWSTRLGLGQEDNDGQVDFEDIPLGQIENYIASNGDMNPVYKRNMAVMANTEQYLLPVDSDSIDSEPDGVIEDNLDRRLSKHTEFLLILSKASSAIDDPKWSDISPSIQLEIINNLLQSHSWSSACNILGLTQHDQEEIQKLWPERDGQIRSEDTQLKRMRQKQLSVLMKMDNSMGAKHPTSHQDVFSKISKRSIRKLKGAIQTDYFLCNAKYVSTARKFLHKRGISPKSVGNWSNSVITIIQGVDDDSGSEISEMGEHQSDSLEIGSTPSCDYVSYYVTGDKPMSATLPQESCINSIGTCLPSTETTFQQESILNPHSKPLNLLPRKNPSQPSQLNGLVCLKIGVERAAQIQASERPEHIAPSQLVLEQPPLDSFFHEPIEAGVSGTFHLASSPDISSVYGSAFSNLAQPVRRILGGSWSYASVRPSEYPASTSSARLWQRLEEARLEARRERREGDSNRERGEHNFFSEPERPSSVSEIQSQSRAPTKVLSSTSAEEVSCPEIDTQLLPESTDVSGAPSPALPDDTIEETDNMSITPPTSDSHSGCTVQPDPTNSTHIGDETNDNDEYDCEIDEMVLLPVRSTG